jgi:formate hydrogenlyase subunit 3/multisubunit Na+/H+ antiporter MnhD subunit
VVLTLLAVLIALLALLAVADAFVPPALTAYGIAGASAAVVVLAAVALVGRTGLVTMVVPIGPPGAAVHLALDPLGACFLLLLFIMTPLAGTAPLPLAGMGLAVLAGDGFALAVGVLLLGAPRRLRAAAAAAVCLIVALALAGAPGDFAMLRAVPLEGVQADAVPLMLLAGAGVLIRLCPAIAVYLVLRMLLDPGGAAQPQWWAVPLLIGGAAIAAAGSLRAALADTVHEALACCALPLFGLSVVALGTALLAGAVDLPSVASRAFDAAWLTLVGHTLCRTLLLAAADAVESGAGTRRLDRLGGLIHGMPVTAASCLAGLFAVAVLPPGLGFAAFWMLFQSLLAAVRIGQSGLGLLVACVAAATALSAGVVALAAVRSFSVAFLGRPRTPRAAVAEDPPRDRRLVLGGLAVGVSALGVLPALALLPAAGWTRATDPLRFLALRTGAEAPGYAPIAVVALLGVAMVVLARALRRGGSLRREPAWTGGFEAPPSWLPFGDPATQYGPASFVEPLRRMRASPPWAASPLHRLARCRDAVLRATAAIMVR